LWGNYQHLYSTVEVQTTNCMEYHGERIGSNWDTNHGDSSWIQCEAPKIAKLVQITPITMVYGTYNYSYWGESKPTYNWGASH
jgi:hypothetical protein